MYRYLVAYLEMSGPQSRFGNCEMTLPRPIRGMNDVAGIARDLGTHYGLQNPVVMSFCLFQDPVSARET